MSAHYCDCTTDADDDCTGGEWCCGGDAHCEAVEAEPACPEARDHEWTSEGCGGCDTNPGVHSLGNTAYQQESRCRLCGLGRTEVVHGSRRDPGQCDSIAYCRHAYDAERDAAG